MSLETTNRLECRYFDEGEQPSYASAGLIMPDVEAQIDHWTCQVAELRRFNKRMELVILQLGGENRHLRTQIETSQRLRAQIESLPSLRARNISLEEQVRFLEDRLNSLAHRTAEKTARLFGRTPKLRVLGRYLLLKAAVLYRVLRTDYHSLRYLVQDWRLKRLERRNTKEMDRRQSSLPSHAVKQEVLRSYAQQYNLRIFVETGTYLGDMVHAMKNVFDQIYSIELSSDLFDRARQRFAADSHIELVQGDSGKELRRLMPRLNQASLFWLDGHYSGGITAKGSKDTPILEELEQILSVPDRGHVVIIDDARLFGTDPAYPSLEELTKYVCSKRPGMRIEVENDSIRITPAPGSW